MSFSLPPFPSSAGTSQAFLSSWLLSSVVPLSLVVLSRTTHDKSGLIQDNTDNNENWLKTFKKVWPLVVASPDWTAGLPFGAAGVFNVTGTIFSQRATLPKTFKNCGWFMQVVNHLVTLVRIFLSDGSNTFKWVNVARANDKAGLVIQSNKRWQITSDHAIKRMWPNPPTNQRRFLHI